MPLSAADAADDDVDDDADADNDADADAAGDTIADSDAVGDAPAVRVREGLPASYRMRHEPHYVEALVAHPVPAPAAGGESTAVIAAPTSSTPSSDDAAVPMPAPWPAALAAAATSLAEAFDAIQSALRDVPTRGRPLRDRVAIELARAEATRGRWLADAAIVMQTDPMPALDVVDLGRVLRIVREALGPENRLSGGAAAMPVPDGVCAVFGDERLLTTAVGAALAAMRAVIEERGDARKMAVTLAPPGAAAIRTVAIAQSAVRIPASAYARFFDGEWREHPAGPSGALLLAAAHRIAVAHGGSLEIGPIDGGGCRLLLSVPAAG